MKIDLRKIKNLIVRKSLSDRVNGFMFNYGDADESLHIDNKRTDHTESRGFKTGKYPIKYDDGTPKYDDEHDSFFDPHPDSY